MTHDPTTRTNPERERENTNTDSSMMLQQLTAGWLKREAVHQFYLHFITLPDAPRQTVVGPLKRKNYDLTAAGLNKTGQPD